MKTLWVERDIEWLPEPNEAHYILDDVLPAHDLITAAYGFLFDEDRFLMSKLVERGWDVPGGHIEPGETPLETMQREVYEESRVRLGSVGFLGYQKILVHGAKPPDYCYPYPLSYQVFYWGHVGIKEPFVPTEEVAERGLFAPKEARQIAWVQRYPALYEAALEAARSGRTCVS
jgi:8-oxo-dGTP pyrophosphatase MutT (NUDIX family)